MQFSIFFVQMTVWLCMGTHKIQEQKIKNWKKRKKNHKWEWICWVLYAKYWNSKLGQKPKNPPGVFLTIEVEPHQRRIGIRPELSRHFVLGPKSQIPGFVTACFPQWGKEFVTIRSILNEACRSAHERYEWLWEQFGQNLNFDLSIQIPPASSKSNTNTKYNSSG